MLLSQTSLYGLRAAAYLGERFADEHCVPVGEIADAVGVPRNYLSKTLHQLARHGVLSSERGPKGGFRLAKPPEQIRLIDVVAGLEPGLDQRVCLLGRPTCSDTDPCAAHERWRDLSDQITHFLEATTVANLAGPQ